MSYSDNCLQWQIDTMTHKQLFTSTADYIKLYLNRVYEVRKGPEVPLRVVADEDVEDGELGDAGHDQEHVHHGHVHLGTML